MIVVVAVVAAVAVVADVADVAVHTAVAIVGGVVAFVVAVALQWTAATCKMVNNGILIVGSLTHFQ